MIGASDEQLDVFNEVWYTVLLNSGRANEGTSIWFICFSRNIVLVILNYPSRLL